MEEDQNIKTICEKMKDDNGGKTPPRRYVKFKFFGYAPIDLAIQLHLHGKKTDVNEVGDDMKPYTECDADYEHFCTKKEDYE